MIANEIKDLIKLWRELGLDHNVDAEFWARTDAEYAASESASSTYHRCANELEALLNKVKG